MKKCPFCAEEIQDEAIKCKHCGEWLKDETLKERGIVKIESGREAEKEVTELEDKVHINRKLCFDEGCIGTIDEKGICNECGRAKKEIENGVASKKANVSEKIIPLKWKWRPKRWWLALIAFWLLSALGAGIIARSGSPGGAENGFIIATMLGFVIWCVRKDRSWKARTRILYVIGAWIIHAILSVLIGVLIAGAIIHGGVSVPAHLVGRLITLLAAFPIIIWTMRRSTLFVQPIIPE